jgi:hypothetical protein
VVGEGEGAGASIACSGLSFRVFGLAGRTPPFARAHMNVLAAMDVFTAENLGNILSGDMIARWGV